MLSMCALSPEVLEALALKSIKVRYCWLAAAARRRSPEPRVSPSIALVDRCWRRLISFPAVFDSAGGQNEVARLRVIKRRYRVALGLSREGRTGRVLQSFGDQHVENC